MGKRSEFERVERDYYPTPIEAVLPLVPHLPKKALFAEPCAGDGRLIRHIEQLTNLKGYWMTDIEPLCDSVGIGDAIKAIETPVIEVHISNTFAREEFRHQSYISPNAKGVILGFGLQSYELALQSF